MAKNATCLLCGTEYEVCKYCQRTRLYTPWKIDFDSPRHFQIYSIVTDIRNNILTNDEAKERLEHLNVTADEMMTFVESVQATLKPVLGVKEKPLKVTKAVVQDEQQTEVQPQKKSKPFRGRKK